MLRKERLNLAKNKRGKILVCVKNKNTAYNLISTAKKLSTLKNLPLQVIYIKPSNEGNNVNSDELEYIYSASKKVGAELTIFFNDDPALIAASFAKQINAKQLIVGINNNNISLFTNTIRTLLPSVIISMISPEGKIYNMYPILGCLNIKYPNFKTQLQHI